MHAIVSLDLAGQLVRDMDTIAPVPMIDAVERAHATRRLATVPRS